MVGARFFVDVTPEGMHVRHDEHIPVSQGCEEARQPGGPPSQDAGGRVPEPLDRNAEPRQFVALLGEAPRAFGCEVEKMKQ